MPDTPNPIVAPKGAPVNIGSKFHRWEVVAFSHRKGKYNSWRCRCECGTEKVVWENSFRYGNSKSCGCLRIEVTASRCTTHGQARRKGTARIYSIWRNMIQRCTNPNGEYYNDYGGRGVKVCERWMDFASFYADMGDAPADLTVDRWPNKDGNYEPGNVRWATDTEQQRNRRNNVMVLYRGEEVGRAELAARFGIQNYTVRGRLQRGWSVEAAVETPVRPCRR